MYFTEVFLHQHGEQRRMFAALDEFPRDDVEGLGFLWKRLEIFLETHAEAEERYFYPHLLELGKGASDADSAADEVLDSVKDHNEIREALRKVSDSKPGTDDWWEAVTECRINNDDHMAEEERRDLADFRVHASRELRHDIAVKFLRFEASKAARGITPRDKDPEEYVETHGPDDDSRS
jgi:hypothetical protein